MAHFTEKGTTQAEILDLLTKGGWAYTPAGHLGRSNTNVLLEDSVRAALGRLNPELATSPERLESAFTQIRRALLAAENVGLMDANEQFTKILRGLATTTDPASGYDVPFQVIDFGTPHANKLVVSDEVTFGGDRYDVVLWVNGIPVVVGECKSPTQPGVSWVDGAIDVGHYEQRSPVFFTPNLLSFATEGRELRYAGIGTSVDRWSLWGDTGTDPNFSGRARVALTVATLLSPATVLNLIEHYAIVERKFTKTGHARSTKLLPRYFQYEAVEAIVHRVLQGKAKRGLIYHTQGAGKTLTMVWAAAQLYLDPRMENPTILAVADRTQLVQQTLAQFVSAGAGSATVASSTGQLQKALANDRRGIIATTVHKFARAGLLSERENIIVLVDEAHRTQEGTLGQDMRTALPNAFWFGFTGTPIADFDRNTFQLFGHSGDPDYVMARYDSDRSIADGTTLPMLVVPRRVEFNIDRDTLNAEFDTFVDENDLSESDKEAFAGKISRTVELLRNPERIEKVVADMLDHFANHMEPHGLKAQVVVGNQELCLLYKHEFDRQIAKTTLDWESAVVISGTGSKNPEIEAFKMSGGEEESLLNRFRTYRDPLRFLIVTSKLGTGFDAPIEGVLYLDKPLKLHTLYQTITRTNRTWVSPDGFVKRYGTIVDYIGLGDGFARAMSPADPDTAQRELDVDTLIDKIVLQLRDIHKRFVGVPREDSMSSLQSALERVPESDGVRDEFQREFLFLQGSWETVSPDVRLRDYEEEYTWYASVYQALPRPANTTELLWLRLGPKTRELVHRNMTQIKVRIDAPTVVIADTETIAGLVKHGKLAAPPESMEGKSADEIIDSIASRLKRREARANMEEHPRFRDLADRLIKLRDQVIQQAEDSIRYLTELFQLAGDLDDFEHDADEGLLEDPTIARKGKLRAIFEEHKPAGQTVLIENVVNDVDELALQITFAGWVERPDATKLLRQQLREVFRRYKLPQSGEPYRSALDFVIRSY